MDQNSIEDLVDLLLMPQPDSNAQVNNKVSVLKHVPTFNFSDQVTNDDTEIRLAKNSSLKGKIDSAKPGKTSLSVEQAARKANIARCLAMYYQMPIDTVNWRPWTIMHDLLPYGQLSRVKY